MSESLIPRVIFNDNMGIPSDLMECEPCDVWWVGGTPCFCCGGRGIDVMKKRRSLNDQLPSEGLF
jgi:hypothetical protein